MATTRSKSPESISSFTRAAIVLAAGHGERAAGGEVVLEVDDEERAGDVPIIGRVREYLLTPDEAAAMDAPGSKDAAVLVALYGDPLTAVFTERRADLRRHAGEISFPGGRQDDPAEDLRTPRCARPRRRSACPPTRWNSWARCRRWARS